MIPKTTIPYGLRSPDAMDEFRREFVSEVAGWMRPTYQPNPQGLTSSTADPHPTYGNAAPGAFDGVVLRGDQKKAEPGLKYDLGKLPLELLPPEALSDVARVLDYGARKYGPHNWRGGMSWSRLLGATLRHIFAWSTGVDRDHETGISHLSHAACCLLFLISYELGRTGTDDRVRNTPVSPIDPPANRGFPACSE